ncbi:MAG: hypothetical protein JXA42_25275 [Anaerolineales bacterium]|nr:hypothetical protein [Anaerolineales bacterium]
MNLTENIIKSLKDNLTSSLGENFIALYHHDDSPAMNNPSDLSTWIVVSPDTDIHLIRQATLPLWKKHAGAMGAGPAVVTPDDIARYQQLYPIVLKEILTPDHLIAGRNILDFVLQNRQPDPLIQLAHVAAEALFCSALVAPASLTPEKESALIVRLSRLARSLNITLDTDPIETLFAIHRYLEGNQITEYQWQGLPADTEPPPHLPNALSLIGFKNQLIVILPQLDRSSLSTTDWNNVTQLVSDEFDNIFVASPRQLILAATVRLAADLAILSFECIWGADILADYIPNEQNIMTSMVFKPLQVLVENLPSLYCTVPESDLGNLIHDTQNILHNIQLQNEILARCDSLSPFMPPNPLPGKEIPNQQRIDAIFRHFRWWVEYLSPN